MAKHTDVQVDEPVRQEPSAQIFTGGDMDNLDDSNRLHAQAIPAIMACQIVLMGTFQAYRVRGGAMRKNLQLLHPGETFHALVLAADPDTVAELQVKKIKHGGVLFMATMGTALGRVSDNLADCCGPKRNKGLGPFADVAAVQQNAEMVQVQRSNTTPTPEAAQPAPPVEPETAHAPAANAVMRQVQQDLAVGGLALHVAIMDSMLVAAAAQIRQPVCTATEPMLSPTHQATPPPSHSKAAPLQPPLAAPRPTTPPAHLLVPLPLPYALAQAHQPDAAAWQSPTSDADVLPATGAWLPMAGTQR